LGASAFWNSMGLSRPVMGLLYLLHKLREKVLVRVRSEENYNGRTLKILYIL
jgi:hypothetical protein